MRLQAEVSGNMNHLTGEVADIFMLMHDQLFMDRLRSLGMKLLFYSRFKDDVKLVMGALKRSTLVKDDLFFKDVQLKEIQADHPIERVIMRVLIEIPNQNP